MTPKANRQCSVLYLSDDIARRSEIATHADDCFSVIRPYNIF